jgi:alpha-2-macroglobulin-like protein
MLNCESCREQMLEYLYGLLEGADRQALQDHLNRCPACQTALGKAQAQQRLLGAAAKATFASVRFEAPSDPAVLPLSTPLPARPRKHQAWTRWAMAASVVLAVGGLASFGAVLANAFVDADSTISRNDQVIALAKERQKDIQQKQAELPAQRERELADLEKQARERQARVVVSGREALQAGAPNEFLIQTVNLNDQLVASNLDVRIVDQNHKALFEEKLPAPNGEARMVVPADVPYLPGSRLSLEVVARVDKNKDNPVELRDELEVSPPVFVTHLTTDKPMYRPGETVLFRSLTLDRFTLKPPEKDFNFVYTVKYPNGKDTQIALGRSEVLDEAATKVILGPDNNPVKGIGAGAFTLDPNDPGGEYTLTVREVENRVSEQHRKFVVQEYELAKLNKELDFTRKTFGPGEEVVAKAKAVRGDKKPVANQKVEATLNVDGVTYGLDGKPTNQPLTFSTDAEGVVLVKGKLPQVIERGEASLSVKFHDGNDVDTITRPVPILLKKLNVEFFPEGGWLVAGVPNRVYFQARTPLGKPAELTGHIEGDKQSVPGAVKTLNDADHPGANQGMGVFTFTPKAGVPYELKIDTPTGIEGKFELPKVEDAGVVMSIPDGVTSAEQPLKVSLSSVDTDRTLLVGAYCRGRLLDHQPKLVKKGEPVEVTLHPAVAAGGVCRVTVFEERDTGGPHKELKPLVERLVYRQPVEKLDLKVTADKKQHVPGDKANLTIAATNEEGQPAPAIVMVKVVDKNVLTLADEKTARMMPTHFLLTSEVRKPEELEYADFMLTDHPQARAAVDLLLGTQGWRRFAEQHPDQFRNDQKEEADRLLVAMGQSASRPTDLLLDADRKINEKYDQEEENLKRQQVEADEALTATKTDPATAQARATLVRFETGINFLRQVGLPVAGMLLLILGVVGVLLAAARAITRPLPYAAAAGVCGLLLLGFAGFSWVKQSPNRANREYARTSSVEAAGRAPQPEAMPQEPDLNKNAPAKEQKDPGLAPPGGPGGFPAPAAPAEDRLGAKLDDKAKDLPPRGGEGGKDGKGKPMPGKPGFGGVADAQAKEKAGNQLGGVMPPRKEQMGRLATGVEQLELKKAQPEAQILRRLREQHQGFGPADAKGGFAGGLRRPEMPRQVALEKLPPFTVREFAHAHAPTSPGQERSDFAETLYWHPVLVLPDGSGRASFDLNDSLTTFEVEVAGHTLDGRIGAVKTNIVSNLPFSLSPTVPIEVTSSDVIALPISIANNTADKRTVQLKVDGKTGLKLFDPAEVQLNLDPESRTRRIFRMQPTLTEGRAQLLVNGKAGDFPDAIIREFRIVPDGFPINGSVSDVLEGSSTGTITLPDTWIKGTLKAKVEVYPSTLADLQKGLEALLREPGGCFEQTSTSNYPNLLILNYLKESDQNKPEIEARARDLLSRGYDKLVAFECQNTSKNAREGYEWFGGTAPAHEALTAYGLLEFRDMAKVHPVNAEMVERTKQYLLSRKDGKGGFQRNPRALDTFGRAPDNVTNAYIVWALTESGRDDDVTKELSALYDQAKTSKDPYFIALVANCLINRDRRDDAAPLLKTLAGAQKDDGHLDAENTSITGSGGRDLQIETTGLTVLAWLKASLPELNPNVQKAVKWIGQQRGGYGGFGSTQSTILALKALIAFAKANRKTAEAGDLTLYLDDQMIVKKHFDAGTQDAVTLEVPDAENVLKPGKNNLRVEITGKNVFPYTLSWSYNTLKPASAENCPVKLTTKLDKESVNEGDAVRLTATVENTSDKGQGMAVAIIGLPAGLTLPESLEQLKKHALVPEDGSRPLISYFELRGRELVLYWRDLAPKQKIEVPIDLNCRVPGEYRGPASRAYLYYNADAKCWVEPVKVAIAVKGE